MELKLAALIAVLCSLVPASPAPQEGLSLGGMVINSSTGEPVPRALVRVVCYSQRRTVASGERPTPAAPVNATAFADVTGRFRFTGLAAGNCIVSARKPQFTVSDESFSGGRVELSASTSDIRIKLLPLAAITGKVMDQDGQPVWQANVIAVSVSTDDGVRQTKDDRSVSTDERGIFRLWNLPPGRYYLKAAGMSRGTYAYIGDTTPQFFANQGFVPSYHGGGQTLDAATPIEVSAGSDNQADLKIRLEPAYAIRGSLSNFVPQRSVRFEFLKNGESVPASPVSLNANTGRFEIQGVIGGNYILHATQDETTADVPVRVAGRDMDGISLTLLPGADLKVHTLFSNPLAGSGSVPDTSGLRRPAPVGFCNVRLYATDGRAGMEPLVSRRIGGGEDTIGGVTAGVYRAVTSCYGGYVQSVILGSQDLLTDPVLRIAAGLQLPAIEITARRGGGVLTGSVAHGKVEKPERMHVVVVPQFAESTGPLENTVSISSGEDDASRFQFANLAPGNYVVYAVAGREELEFRDPKFLQSLTGGVRVQVEDGVERKIEISEVIR